MKRPTIVHFLAIMTEENLNIKASLTVKENIVTNQSPKSMARGIAKEIAKEIPTPRFPIQAYKLLTGNTFKVKVMAYDSQQEIVFKKTFDSDKFGNIHAKISLDKDQNEVSALQVYEVSSEVGLDLHMGTFIPLSISNPKKIIICDFDKTLVDTKYSTTTEVYRSLTKPLSYFPTITNSVEILKSYIEKGYHPFILSASPHFYEEAMRDWLYQNQIYTAGIFLKDYRRLFSLLELDLTPKDLKIQGLYKLNHLLDILMLTGIPDDLVLMGHNFESDPVIYLSLASLLNGHQDPWQLWNYLRKVDAFQMNKKQNSILLNKVYQIHNQLTQKKKVLNKDVNIKIYIRKKVNETKLDVPQEVDSFIPLVELYSGPSQIKKIETPVPS
ncbi:MAG: hypothetical protein CME63_06285 [Halobacteriovoraceae bacterium]|nr:hypothetical protein [Halobacteriovoraceae bacterium]